MNHLEKAVYTIGHSNHTWERFVELLLPHGIEVLVDVRSYPRSRFASWSNRERLGHGLAQIGLEYLWMGDSLGGMPKGPRRQRDVNDQSVLDWYRERSVSPDFLAGIDEIASLVDSKRIAVMCSEGDPRQCHRTLLLAPAFVRHDILVRHIDRKTGRVISEFASIEDGYDGARQQRTLMGDVRF